MLKAAMLLGGLVAAGLALRLLGAGALDSARPTLRGAFLLVGGGALLTAVGVPRQVVAFAGGYAFGAWRGGLLSLLAQMLGCCADFWWARSVAPDWARRRLAGRVDRLLRARPFTATLTLRLLPVGNNLLLNLLAGLSAVPAGPFLAASALGYLPQTIVFALLGSGTQVGRAGQIAVGAALFAASAALGYALLRRQRSEIV